jgi:hypothetical protein
MMKATTKNEAHLRVSYHLDHYGWKGRQQWTAMKELQLAVVMLQLGPEAAGRPSRADGSLSRPKPRLKLQAAHGSSFNF